MAVIVSFFAKDILFVGKCLVGLGFGWPSFASSSALCSDSGILIIHAER